MTTILLVIHLLVALALVGVILLQRSEGGALGGLGGAGGGGGGFGGLFTARGGANFLTRTTAVLATCFIGTSLLLAILASSDRESRSILETLPTEQSGAPAEEAPAAGDQEPQEPTAPLAQ